MGNGGLSGSYFAPLEAVLEASNGVNHIFTKSCRWVSKPAGWGGVGWEYWDFLGLFSHLGPSSSPNISPEGAMHLRDHLGHEQGMGSAHLYFEYRLSFIQSQASVKEVFQVECAGADLRVIL